MAKKPAVYNASSIDVNLLDVDKVRASCQVYIGIPDNNGMLLIAKEPIQNGFDEAILDEVKNKTVVVSLNKNEVWISDAGRGIPIEIHKTSKMSTLTTVLTLLSAGGKQRKDGTSGYSKATSGTHGMGAAITNALSQTFEVWTFRDNSWYNQTFAFGKPTSKVVKAKCPVIPNIEKKYQPKCGTTIKFVADTKIFNKGASLEIKDLKEFLGISAYILSGIKIHFHTGKKEYNFYEPKGLAAFLDKRIEEIKAEKYGKIFEFSTEDFDVAMCWTDASDEHMNSFVNAVPTPEHGTHVNGLNQSVMDVLSTFKLKKHDFRSDDLRDGLVCVINARVHNPQFTTQNKIKLSTPEAADMVKSKLKPALTKFFSANKALAKKIIEVAHEVAQNKAELKLNKKSIRELNSNKKGRIILPSKALLSLTKDANKRELYLVEGESAKAGCKKARDSEFQEILPMQGKPLNVMQAKNDKIYANKEIFNVLQMVGYNPDKKDKGYRIKNKLILLSDSDDDGKHISVLWCALTYKMFRDFIEQGKLYTIDNPLYSAQINGKKHYANTKEELQAVAPGKKVLITRFKGLGEMNPSDLAEIAFNVKTRRLRQIKMSDKKGIAKFIKLVSKDVAYRQEILGVSNEKA